MFEDEEDDEEEDEEEEDDEDGTPHATKKWQQEIRQRRLALFLKFIYLPKSIKTISSTILSVVD